jgi:hypothetical protein
MARVWHVPRLAGKRPCAGNRGRQSCVGARVSAYFGMADVVVATINSAIQKWCYGVFWHSAGLAARLRSGRVVFESRAAGQGVRTGKLTSSGDGDDTPMSVSCAT